jgi:hypothetical protein
VFVGGLTPLWWMTCALNQAPWRGSSEAMRNPLPHESERLTSENGLPHEITVWRCRYGGRPDYRHRLPNGVLLSSRPSTKRNPHPCCGGGGCVSVEDEQSPSTVTELLTAEAPPFPSVAIQPGIPTGVGEVVNT